MTLYEPMNLNGKVQKQKNPEIIIIHNSGDDKDTVASVVHYHRSKWADVGYNWLIAGGAINVGRSEMFVGAHSRGANDGSVGICVVGNYMAKLPKKEDIEALVRILAIECFAQNLPVSKIIGHSDVKGASTDCPGTMLHGYLPEIRAMVTAKLKERNDDTKKKARG